MSFKQVQKKGNGNQLVQNVAKMLQQGQDPKQVLQLLVKHGVPQKQAIQLVQGVMQQMQGQHQESPQQEQQEPAGQQSPQEEQAEMKMGGYRKMQKGGASSPGASIHNVNPMWSSEVTYPGDTLSNNQIPAAWWIKHNGYGFENRIPTDLNTDENYQLKQKDLQKLNNYNPSVLEYLRPGMFDPRSLPAPDNQSRPQLMNDFRKIGNSPKLMNTFRKMQEGGRLVDKVPDGYIPMDKPNYYHNPQQTASLKPAQATTNQGGAGYDQFLQKAATQYPIDELVRKGYGTQQGLAKYQGMYQPTDDIVFTQAQAQPTAPVQPQPTPQFAGRGQMIYDSQKHGVGELYYPTRDSKSVTDGGTLNSAPQSAHIKFRNDFGYTGEETDLAGPDIQKYLGTTNTFPTGDLYNELKSRAKAPLATKKRGGMIKGKISKTTMTNPYC